MVSNDQNIQAIQDIRKMMERSSRFISLSGWSGIAAGITALIGTWVGNTQLKGYHDSLYKNSGGCAECLATPLIVTAGAVFAVALVSATSFTYFKSRKEGVAIWGRSVKRLLWNTLLPMAAGALLIWKMIELRQYELIAPSALLFYGVALINGSKYTMGEVRFLGFGQAATGALSLLDVGHPLIYLAAGFGLLHIIYGIAMWWKYDRAQKQSRTPTMQK